MQDETEGAMKISESRASKRAPTCHSCTITPKSLPGQPLDYLIHYNTQTLIYRPPGRGFCNPLPRGLLSKMLFPEKNDFSRKVIVL